MEINSKIQIALIIHRSNDKKFQSRLLHSKAIKEGFHFATLKWHRLTCYLNWAILIDTGYPHDGRADKYSYPHDGRADKNSYPTTVVPIRILIRMTGITNTLC